jgi:hypothetical protein
VYDFPQSINTSARQPERGHAYFPSNPVQGTSLTSMYCHVTALHKIIKTIERNREDRFDTGKDSGGISLREIEAPCTLLYSCENER